MTNHNNAAQAAEQEIREAFELTYAANADDPACASDLSHFTNGWRACIMSQVGKPAVVKLEVDAAAAIARINDEVARLRAPVADERAAFEAAYKRRQGTPINLELLRDGNGYTDGADGARNLNVAWEAWQDARAALASAPVDKPAPEHFKPPFDNCSFRMCDLPGQCRGEGKCHHPASAPVAGEAKNYPGENAAERLDNMADDQPPGSQAQSDLYAAATIWRKHIAHRAAPQASAEDVRDAALEEAAKLMDQTLRSNGAALIRGLKRSQAHKDGGQQRACTCHPDDRPAGDCQKQYAATDCQQRAALSAPQAEQGERDA